MTLPFPVAIALFFAFFGLSVAETVYPSRRYAWKFVLGCALMLLDIVLVKFGIILSPP